VVLDINHLKQRTECIVPCLVKEVNLPVWCIERIFVIHGTE